MTVFDTTNGDGLKIQVYSCAGMVCECGSRVYFFQPRMTTRVPSSTVTFSMLTADNITDFWFDDYSHLCIVAKFPCGSYTFRLKPAMHDFYLGY